MNWQYSKESKIVEGHLRPDHIHMCVSIPPKLAASNAVGYIKGKSFSIANPSRIQAGKSQKDMGQDGPVSVGGAEGSYLYLES